MVRPLARPDDLRRCSADARISALLIGPGAGIDDATREPRLRCWQTRRAVVLDADAITVFAGHHRRNVRCGPRPVRTDAARGRIRAFVPFGGRQTDSRARGRTRNRRGHRAEGLPIP